MYDSLPKNEKVVEIDVVGEESQLRFKGDFTVLCVLDMAARHAEELERTRLLADYQNPTPKLFGIAAILSKVRSRVIDSPKWWKDSNGGSTILDENIVMELYEACNKAEEEWRAKVKKAAEAAKEELDKSKESEGNVETESK